MTNTTKTPNQTEELSQRVKELEEVNAQQKATIKWYEEQFRLMQQKRFASSSEKTPDNQIELPLFNETEVTEAPEVEEQRRKRSRIREKNVNVRAQTLSISFRLKS